MSESNEPAPSVAETTPLSAGSPALTAAHFATFDGAAQRVLRVLHELTGWRLSIITPSDDDPQWLVLHGCGPDAPIAGETISVRQGDLARLVAGIAAGGDDLVRDAAASSAQRGPVLVARPGLVRSGSAVGAPIFRGDGEFFGLLCGVGSGDAHADDAEQRFDAVVLVMAQLLSTGLVHQLEAERSRRRAERAEAEALLDPLTGLYNRRGWERLLQVEEERALRYGHPAAILMIDLDNLKTVNDMSGHASGDALIRRAAATLRSISRESDVAARIGGDEFALLAVETNVKAARALHDRLERAMREAGVRASVGIAQRRHLTGLPEAWTEADAAMYAAKRRRAPSRASAAADLEPLARGSEPPKLPAEERHAVEERYGVDQPRSARDADRAQR